tara:strand:- start:214 stop:573 length:360 start_codon:yes stop_codon:yes gene_type:complete
MKEKKEYYFLPLADCLERLSDCLEIRKVVKAYIKDNVHDEEAWNLDLMTLLCEYYSINSRYAELIGDLILTPPSTDDETDEEIITVDAHKYAILSSYSKLMLVDEIELKYKHRVHLFFQ